MTAETPHAGGAVTFLNGGEVDNLFPDGAIVALGLGAVSAADRRTAIYDGLALERDDQGGVERRLATTIESPDGKVWTIGLRPGVTFTDGTAFDAPAVQFNWQRLVGREAASIAALANLITSVEVVAPLTLRVTLKEVTPHFDLMIAQSALTYIGSPTALVAKGAAFASAPVGAGAFMMKEWVRGDHMTLVRNPDYYGSVYLDELTIRSILDDGERAAALHAGAGDLEVTANTEAYRQAREAGLQVSLLRANMGHILQFNVTRPPFDDVRARRAVVVAIDYEALNQARFSGAGHMTNAMFMASSPFYDAAVKFPTYDPDEAQRLLDAIAAESGQPLSFTILAPASGMAVTAEWLQTYFTAHYRNIEPQLEVLPPHQWALRGDAGEFDVVHNMIRFNQPSPYLENHLGTNAPENWSQYSNPDLDRALEQGRLSIEPTERRAAYSTVQAIVARDLPVHVLMGAQYHLTAQPELRGLDRTYAIGVPLWNEVWRTD